MFLKWPYRYRYWRRVKVTVMTTSVSLRINEIVSDMFALEWSYWYRYLFTGDDNSLQFFLLYFLQGSSNYELGHSLCFDIGDIMPSPWESFLSPSGLYSTLKLFRAVCYFIRWVNRIISVSCSSTECAKCHLQEKGFRNPLAKFTLILPIKYFETLEHKTMSLTPVTTF